MLRVGSLFTGIGGIELGLERAGGFKTVWMTEIEPHARKVLAARFPGIPIYEDVQDIGIKYAVPPVDVLVGGFPCQDISLAGKREGINEGQRSGLWREFYRIIRLLRPQYVIVENVAATLTPHRKRREPAPLARILGDLSESRYDAEWQIISAQSVGAPHKRERAFIVAYPQHNRCQGRYTQGQGAGTALSCREDVASPNLPGLEEWEVFGSHASQELAAIKQSSLVAGQGGQWAVEPSVGRMVDGFPGRVDEIERLGNAVVPQVAEFVGRMVLLREARRHPGQMVA